MATKNGNYQNHARIEWVYTSPSVKAGDTHVSIPVQAFLRMASGASINGNWTVTASGQWGSRSKTMNIVLSGGQRKRIWNNTGVSVPLQASGRNVTFTATVHHFHGRTTDTLTVWVPAKVPAPGKPTLTLSNATTNGFRANWTTPGSALSNWSLRVSKNSNMSNYTAYNGSKPPRNISGLEPGTTYYAQALNYNASGWGTLSDVKSITTLPDSAPTLSLSGNPAGTEITAEMTAQGSPDDYFLEWEYVAPGGAPAAQNGSKSGGNIQKISGRIPGAEYRVRAWTKTGAHESPKTVWQHFVMNNPGTLSGDYFDGSTAAKADVSYRWAGTAHASISEAIARPAKGWNQPAGMVQYRATGTLYGGGEYLARFVAMGNVDLETVYMGADTLGRVSVSDNLRYFARPFVRPNVDVDLRVVLRWLDSGGSLITADVGTLVSVGAGDTVQIVGDAVSPAGAEFLEVGVTGMGVLETGDQVDIDGLISSVGNPTSYFDGDFDDTAEREYGWEATPNESPSYSVAVPGGVVDPFVDPDCPPVPSPPRAPIIENPCIEEVGIWRRYWAEIPASEVSGWLDVLPTFTIVTGGYDAGQVRIRIFENPDNLAPDDFIATDEWVSEQTILFVPANSVVVLDSVTERAFGRSNGDWQDINHLLYGVGGRPASWSVLSCGISYLVAFDMPIDAPLGNVQISAALTIREG